MKLLYSTSCCSKPIWLCFFNGKPNEMFSRSSKATFSNSVKMNGDQWMSRSKKDTTESSIHNSGAIFRLLKPCDSFIGGKYWNLGSFPMKTLLYGHHSFSLYFKCSSGISFCVPQIKGHPGFKDMRPWWRWENDEKNVHIWWTIAFMELSVTTLGQHSWGVAS